MNEWSCPFCNAPLPALLAPPAGEKQACPRCGEPVAAARWPIDAGAGAKTALETAPAASAPNVRTSNRKTGLIVLGIMAGMAVGGLSFALVTTQFRRSHDPKKVQKFEPISARRPGELVGLGYLPADCQIIAGLHVAEMLADQKAGRELLAEPRPALLDWPIKEFTRTTGMKMDDLDHIIVGMAFDAHFPQLVMIVRTRSKIDLGKIVDARPVSSRNHDDRPLYEFAVDGHAVWLWAVDGRTLVYVVRLDGLKLEHLRGLSATPRQTGAAVPQALAKTMNERLPAHPFAWVVGRIDQLGPARDFLPLLLGKGDIRPLAQVRSLVLSLERLQGLTFNGEFQMADAKSASGFKLFLEEARIAGAKSHKVESSPPQEPEQWVAWQVRGEPSALRDILDRGKK